MTTVGSNDSSANAPTPAVLGHQRGLQHSDGPSGDAAIDVELQRLKRATEDFTTSPDVSGDAADVVDAGASLHATLQKRLDEASG